MNAFDKKIGGPLLAADLDILQVNVGLKCNQACIHCHLECSPAREELMERSTMERIMDLAVAVRPGLVDITGGAPELNPHLKDFVSGLVDRGVPVQSRTNLSAMEEPGAKDYPEFFAERGVALVASMPCYLEENVNRMRGDQCYASSIRMLKRLNGLGYGRGDGLTLDLVFNPGGPDLPPGQECLEKDYKRELLDRHGVGFDRLLTITNLPIGRFMEMLKEQGRDGEYMDLLKGSFNPATVDGLMCRHQVNIGWDGRLYDCDFNQALNLGTGPNAPDHLSEFDLKAWVGRQIATGPHCLGCTAGAGSSCGGAISV
ncbi:arsenosugar biosynthesis radical SAM (seleno)protein ArsS [uncultured Pseudodesulfovibrio sp.]|uniref:arsenosugar biosynthesis radical SAM (seleno)protein ArsS n=1 Tax=uncultured Pseudodesulfovibrio sp. TaxID=2035858 RepID=UPI003748AA1B